MAMNPRTSPQHDGPPTHWTGMEALEPRLLLAANPQPKISIANAAVVESNNTQTATLTFDVTRSGTNKALRGVSVVRYSVGGSDGDNSATAGTDFTGGTGRVRFARGETAKTITVQVIGDDLFEGNYERLFVTADGGKNYKQLARAQDDRGPRGVGFIIEDDTAPQLSIADAAVAEGDDGTTTLSFDVTLDQAAGVPVYFVYSTTDNTATDGADYTAVTNGLGVIAAGQTSGTVSITIAGDTVYENAGVDEDFTVDISTAINATILDGTATGTITEDDTEPTVSVADVTVDEDEGTMTFTVSLSNASDQAITVDYTTTDGTATSGSGDYVPDNDTLTFAAGETTKTVVVTITDDTTDEDDETLTLDLSNPSNATIDDNQATGTITDDDAAPTLSIDDVSIAEDDAGGEVTFTITLSEISGKSVTMLVNTQNGTAVSPGDYDPLTDEPVTINAGDLTQQVSIDIVDDGDVEGDETFSLVVSSPTNATITDGTGVATIEDDDD